MDRARKEAIVHGSFQIEVRAMRDNGRQMSQLLFKSELGSTFENQDI